ncbi:MAG: M4 family metallopeptidase [bacterium]|nr:M4 family metallopeptidase [bacterium]
MKKKIGLLFLTIYPLAIWSANPIDVQHQSMQGLQLFKPGDAHYMHSNLVIAQKEIDFNKTQHIRIKQFYQGYPVIRGDIIVHLLASQNVSITTLQDVLDQTNNPNVKMNGVVYQNLEDDLQNTPNFIFSSGQKNKALEHAIITYKKNHRVDDPILNKSARLMIYVDKYNKAHWVYWIKFYIPSFNHIPELPGFVVDAQTFTIYHQWSEIEHLSDAQGGGNGGNNTISIMSYDGSPGNLPILNFTRNDELAICYLSNDEVTVSNFSQTQNIVHYPCPIRNPNHNNIYWNQNLDMANGGYSPANDAFYAATMARKMFNDWYHLAPIVKYGKPLNSLVLIHLLANNAYWDPVQMAIIVGDGDNNNYPLTSLDVIGHEMAHGFTIQHSHIVSMDNQSGAIIESFSDITGQAVQYYVHGTNNWMIGHDNQKSHDLNAALRYLHIPTLDGHSIDHWSNYNNNLDAHFVGGIFNKAFYLLATSPGWDVHMAYNVWVQANRYYWLPLPTMSSFGSAACGILSASEDYNYDKAPIKETFNRVGIDISNC